MDSARTIRELCEIKDSFFYIRKGKLTDFTIEPDNQQNSTWCLTIERKLKKTETNFKISDLFFC